MAESILLTKSKELSLEIVTLCNNVKKQYKESVITNQLMRSGTSINANIHESKYAQGKRDFASKMQIALKECYETESWLELLYKSGFIVELEYKNLQQKCGSIRRMLISSINTVNKSIDG
ncbi:MAG: four helix bundle protein [Clostridia bacterium]|nr:four helix bundle protein [Clostridia bacterium]